MKACNICGTLRTKQWKDGPGRPNTRCPTCGSGDRHRAMFATMQKLGIVDRPIPRKPQLLLSISTDPAYIDLLRQRYFVQVLVGDKKFPPDRIGDVCDLPYEDDSIDIAVSNHVMEHVKDDRRGTREICRVLKPGGLYISCVPCCDQSTCELDEPGRHGHWRTYGRPDYVQLLLDCGFASVQMEPASEKVNVFVATKARRQP